MLDASGVAVTLPAPPRRIVSLIPSVTEILFALGLFLFLFLAGRLGPGDGFALDDRRCGGCGCVDNRCCARRRRHATRRH